MNDQTDAQAATAIVNAAVHPCDRSFSCHNPGSVVWIMAARREGVAAIAMVAD
jgi:hypothetical protein